MQVHASGHAREARDLIRQKPAIVAGHAAKLPGRQAGRAVEGADEVGEVAEADVRKLYRKSLAPG